MAKLKVLKTVDTGSELPTNYTMIKIVSDTSGNPQTSYEVSTIFSQPMVYKYNSQTQRFNQLSDNQFTFTSDGTKTTFTFSQGSVAVNDTLVVFDNTGNFLQPDPIIVGLPGETYSRTGSFYLYADGANFGDINITVADIIETGGAKPNWVTFSLDGQTWSSSLNIASIEAGNQVEVKYKIEIPEADRNNIQTGLQLDLSLNITAVEIL